MLFQSDSLLLYMGLADTVLQLHPIAAPTSINNYITLHQTKNIDNNHRLSLSILSF